MDIEPLIFSGVCDWSGLVRGKAFLKADLASRLHKGVGFTHSNIMMSCFGPTYSTLFGTEGDLFIRPDPNLKVDVPFEEGMTERIYLGDIANIDGLPWDFCRRTFLIRAFKKLEDLGLRLVASFEQEFVLAGVEEKPGATYALDAYRRQGQFGEMLMGAIRTAGFKPDSFLPECGPPQYEATVHPEVGVRAAYAAVVLREMARAVAWRVVKRAISPHAYAKRHRQWNAHPFKPWDGDRPVTHDPAAPLDLAPEAASFFAGVVKHLPAVAAFSAPSLTSYYRLTPNRWAPVYAKYRPAGPRGCIACCTIVCNCPKAFSTAIQRRIPCGRCIELHTPRAGSFGMGWFRRYETQDRPANRKQRCSPSTAWLHTGRDLFALR